MNRLLLLVIYVLAWLTSCQGAPFLSWLGFGRATDSYRDDQIDRKYDELKLTHLKGKFYEHTLGKKEKKHKHSSERAEGEYDTYYVRLPDHNTDQHVYDHSEGVGVWELPPIWDGRLEIPNLVPKKKSKKDGHVIYGGDIKPDERVVKGWDNRWGLRVAIPYLGDFQYLREIGPGDFIPKLGPGKFYYPGPGEVDDYGHKAYDPNEGFERPPRPTPVVDLTEYEGLRNYGW